MDIDKQELTDKQKEFLRYVAQGHSNRRIAELMHISRTTSEQYCEKVKNKLNLLSKEEVKQYALQNGYGEI